MKPSHEALLNELRETLLWAELRQDQRARGVEADVARLARTVRRVKRDLARRKPSPQVLAEEPNDLAGIRALRPRGPRRLWDRFDPAAYRERLTGAWLARCAGCTLGAAVEQWTVEDMEQMADFSGMDFPPTDYWTVAAAPHRKRYGMSLFADYTRDRMRHVPVDDDLTYTLLGLLVLEDCGPRFTTADVGRAWVRYLPMACTAEHVTLENLKAGLAWRRAGEKDNPYVELIGADIRSDPWGYAAPGLPEKAAELAWRDAILSHRYSGVYGAMYFSAAIAAAFAVDEPLEACRIALSEVPRKCRFRDDVVWSLRAAEKIKDYRHARSLLDRRFPGMHLAHTNNNAAATIFGLALGGRDVTKVISNTVAIGLDNDCTAATAGSIVGACVGADAVATHWTRPFGNKVRTYINGHEWFTQADIVRRFTRAARSVWADDAPRGVGTAARSELVASSSHKPPASLGIGRL